MQSGSPFYHFKTKQDILVAVMEEGLTEGLRKAEEVMALALPPEQRLVRMIRTQIGTILEDGSDFIRRCIMNGARFRRPIAAASSRSRTAMMRYGSA